MARDLQAGATDIAYEWLTVAEMAALLHPITGARTPEQNAFLEAGLVHYRCLVNFACGGFTGSWHPDDLKPEDFLGRPWWPADPSFDQLLRGRLAAINQCLQHLSWEREKHAFMWPFGLLAHEAHYLMGLFLAEVPRDSQWRLVLESAAIRAEGALPPREKWRSTVVQPAPPRREAPPATR
jgi:hypothetical protein